MFALDVSARWNSTYMMLEAACKYEKDFDRMDEEYGDYVSYFGD